MDELPQKWRDEAEQDERLDARVDAAKIKRQHADEVERAFREWRTEPLTISDAADWSGYSEDHLRQMVREGRLPDVARDEAKQGAAILVPRHCLPRKAIHQRRSSTEDRDSPSTTSSRSGETRVGRALEDVASGHSGE